MQHGNGKPFTSIYLNIALKEQILHDTGKRSTRIILKQALSTLLDWNCGQFVSEGKYRIQKAIMRSKLPKFDTFKDNFNGMGISVHDTWATHITLKSLQIRNDKFSAVVHFQIQDHFGLDSIDMTKSKFYPLRFFRIWFLLQRFNQFGYKPFMTNMEATITIDGKRDERIY